MTSNDEQEPILDIETDQDNYTPPPKLFKKPRLIVVEPLLVAFIFFSLPGAFISSQYILQSIRAELGVNLTNNGTKCNASGVDNQTASLEAEAQSQAAYFQLYLNIVQGFPAFFICLFLGNYSDKAGRKYSIIPPCIGSALMSLSFVLVIALKANRNFLIIGAFFNGLGGYFTSMLGGCLSYVADTTSIEKRTLRITIVEMCMLLPAILSSSATGYWVRYSGFLLPFIAVLAGQVLCIVYSIFFIPDSFEPDKTAKFFTFTHLRDAARLYFTDDGRRRNILLLILLGALIGPFFVAFSQGIDTLFEMNLPLCWDSVMLGIFSSADIAVVSIGGLVCAVLLRKCFTDMGIILLSGTICTVRLVYKSFVQNTLMMFLTLPLYPFGFLFVPTMRSMMSKHVTQAEFGSLFAGISAVEALCVVGGQMMFNPIYAATNASWSGAVYIAMAACDLAGVVLVLAYKIMSIYTKKSSQLQDPTMADRVILSDDDMLDA